MQSQFQVAATLVTIMLLIGYTVVYIVIVSYPDESSKGQLEYLSSFIFLFASIFLGYTTFSYCRRQFELYGDAFQRPIAKVRSITIALVVGYTLNAIILLTEAVKKKTNNVNEKLAAELSVICTLCQILPLCVVMGIHLREMYFNRKRN